MERDGQQSVIEADTIVLAAGAIPENALEEVIKEKGISYQVVGDAAKIGTAFDAVHDGFLKGMAI